MSTRDCDLIVVGSGASGLAAAVTAASLGLSVIVVEKDRSVGGTSAWSGGWLWIPRNELAVAAGIAEDISEPREYLRHELGEAFNPALVEMFLEQGPRMVAFMRRETSVDFIPGNVIPDFHGKTPHAGLGGRSLCGAPFDGRQLGEAIKRLRRPLDLISPFGMGIASGADLQAFLDASSKPKAAWHVVKRFARHFRDLLLHGRGLHLVNGNALVARLFKSANDLGVTILTDSPAQEMLVESGRVAGLRTGNCIIRAARGVVLAAGGFPHDQARMAELFPHAPTGREHHSAAPETNTGDGMRLGEAAGGYVRKDLLNAGAWAPVSLVPKDDGAVGRFPHLVERAKPGVIMVLKNGRRFTNEANSYHDVMQALFAAGETEAWLLCDHEFHSRYGLGRSRPFPYPVAPWLKNGYLKRGDSLAALAAQCGIDADRLEKTLANYNRHAERGEDPEFGRGDTPYNRIQGEARHKPNPCVAPIRRGPFYAVKIVPGSLGTFAALQTDEHARVLRPDGSAVSGLWAVGNDMSSMMGGRYPAGGITLGPGMTFGYVAAHDAAGVPLENNRNPGASS
jgi:succinate dehydrogenase/fumarate reductase flavoprotein subunit